MVLGIFLICVIVFFSLQGCLLLTLQNKFANALFVFLRLKISRQIFNQKEWSQVFPVLHPCRKCLACVFITLFESLRLFLLAKLLLFFYVTLLKSILLHDKPTAKRSKLILTLSRSLQTLSHPKDNRNLFIFAKSPYSGAWNFHSRSV